MVGKSLVLPYFKPHRIMVIMNLFITTLHKPIVLEKSFLYNPASNRKKFTRNFSSRDATYVKKNSVPAPTPDNENLYAIGFGARYKVSRHVAIASEYYYLAT